MDTNFKWVKQDFTEDVERWRQWLTKNHGTVYGGKFTQGIRMLLNRESTEDKILKDTLEELHSHNVQGMCEVYKRKPPMASFIFAKNSNWPAPDTEGKHIKKPLMYGLGHCLELLFTNLDGGREFDREIESGGKEIDRFMQAMSTLYEMISLISEPNQFEVYILQKISSIFDRWYIE